MADQASPREARLRADFAGDYPYLRPGVWEPAAVIADRVRAHRLSQPNVRFISIDRALDPAHFEFRGGGERLRER